MPRRGPRSTDRRGTATPEEPQTQTHAGRTDNSPLGTFVLRRVLPTRGLEVKLRKNSSESVTDVKVVQHF